MSKEDENQPTIVSLNEARAYIRWLSKMEKKKYILPTLVQLKAVKESGAAFLAGKEWTLEGWIYDPILDKTEKHPKFSDRAAFRVVEDKR